jgi:flagellar biosynthetic protein FliR
MIITFSQVGIFFLILARLMGMTILAPVFSRKEVFVTVKMSLVFWVAGLLLFVVPLPPEVPTTPITYGFALVLEIFIGTIMGFVTDLMIVGIEFAGSLMDTQAGLSVATLLDPSSGRNITLISQVIKWTTFMIFLQIDGHHMLITATVESFHLLPPGGGVHMTNASQYLVQLGGEIFSIGVQLAAPILLVVFMIDFAFGLLNKVAEQVNVFQLGFQVKPIVSIIIIFAIIPSLIQLVRKLLEKIASHLLLLLHHLSA